MALAWSDGERTGIHSGDHSVECRVMAAISAAQQPQWPDAEALKQAEAQLATLPPLIFAGEARRLTSQLADVANGRAFLLQAGDCAESFAEFSADTIRDKLKIILQMAVALTYAAGVPVVKVGRIAGQFAKPRSNATERIGDAELDVFRGHMVNDDAFDVDARRPDPHRLVARTTSPPPPSTCCAPSPRAASPICPRSTSGTSSSWPPRPRGNATNWWPSEIDRALRFMAACGSTSAPKTALHQVDFWTSHDALILPYEEALTRQDSLSDDWIDCSAYLLWIGERTRQLDGARSIPLRCHQSPGGQDRTELHPDEAVALCERLNPGARARAPDADHPLWAGPGRGPVPPLLAAVGGAEHPVVWTCDPMHGNTFASEGGRKTRRFDDILGELRSFFAVHRAAGTWPGGVHVELTGDDVTECLGGAEEISKVTSTSATPPPAIPGSTWASPSIWPSAWLSSSAGEFWRRLKFYPG